jgi:uncharacterized protein (TIGR02594 family)
MGVLIKKNLSMSSLLNVALCEYGVKEILGKEDNPRVLAYFKEIGINDNAIKDETAWCSAFINWCAFKSDMESSGKLNARSWLEVGRKIIEPMLGDIVVFWREAPTSWKGHVAIFISEDKFNVFVLGGNQSGSVCIKKYPKTQVLGYRRLRRITTLQKDNGSEEENKATEDLFTQNTEQFEPPTTKGVERYMMSVDTIENATQGKNAVFMEVVPKIPKEENTESNE